MTKLANTCHSERAKRVEESLEAQSDDVVNAACVRPEAALRLRTLEGCSAQGDSVFVILSE